jgi:hypothetical protein
MSGAALRVSSIARHLLNTASASAHSKLTGDQHWVWDVPVDLHCAFGLPVTHFSALFHSPILALAACSARHGDGSGQRQQRRQAGGGGDGAARVRCAGALSVRHHWLPCCHRHQQAHGEQDQGAHTTHMLAKFTEAEGGRWLLSCDTAPRSSPYAWLQLRAAALLKLPVIVTEQYPKALGNTVEELQGLIPEGSPGACSLSSVLGSLMCIADSVADKGLCLLLPINACLLSCSAMLPAVVAKTLFSMCTEEVNAAFDKLPAVKKVLIVGIETHVCVLQTTLDLLGTWLVDPCCGS